MALLPVALTSIRLEEPSFDLDEGNEQAALFTCTSENTDPVFVWKDFFSSPKLQKNAVFMLSLSPHHRQDCSTCSITDELAKQNLLFLHPPESFPVEVNALHNEKTIKKFSLTACFGHLLAPKA